MAEFLTDSSKMCKGQTDAAHSKNLEKHEKLAGNGDFGRPCHSASESMQSGSSQLVVDPYRFQQNACSARNASDEIKS